MQNFNDIISPTRVYHPTEESTVVSAEKAKELYKEGWYDHPVPKDEKKKPEVVAEKTSEKKPIEAPKHTRKSLEKMKFFALRSLHKKVVGKDERNMKTAELIEGILAQEAE